MLPSPSAPKKAGRDAWKGSVPAAWLSKREACCS